MKNYKSIAIFGSFIALFTACVNNNPNSNAKEEENIQYKPEPPTEADKAKLEVKDVTIAYNISADSTTHSEDQKGQQDKQKQQPVVKIPQVDWDKKIIKTASLNFEVKEFKRFNTGFRDKIKKIGGYIAQEEQNESDFKIENVVTIKVPIDQFDNAVTELGVGVEKTIEKKISSQDVTSEFVDTRSRLEAKKQVRLRYLDLLKQAKSMADILSVQSEINEIQVEIEAATGRINYLSNSSAYSTINLTFFQVLNPSAVDPDKPAFLTRLSHSFSIGWNWMKDLFIGIISIWPLGILIFIGWIIYRKTKPAKTNAVKI